MSVKPVKPMPSDIEIAQAADAPAHRQDRRTIGLGEDDLDLYGKYKAKIHLDVLDRVKDRPQGKYVDVTAITPTPLGEGKTTTTVGLSQALGAHLGKKGRDRRPPAQHGPDLRHQGRGRRRRLLPGRADGGLQPPSDRRHPRRDRRPRPAGRGHRRPHAARVLPGGREALRRFLPARQEGRAPLLPGHAPPPQEARHRQDRPRRPDAGGEAPDVPPGHRPGQHHLEPGHRHQRPLPRAGSRSAWARRNWASARDTGYDISVASEIMAILALTTGLADMRERLGRMVIGTSKAGEPVTAEDLGVAGALTVLMKDAIMPNLMQTVEDTPAIVHAGPFANIAHGNSSIIADQIALRLVGEDGYVVTESGFGADCGMEKFMNIKCRASGLVPNCVVIVATIRALKMHGGGPKVVAGKPLAPEYTDENLDLLDKGLPNMAAHIKNALRFGVPVVVAVNRFTADTDAEIEMVRKAAIAAGAEDAVMADHWAKGGAGAVDLAKAVIAACAEAAEFPVPLPARVGHQEEDRDDRHRDLRRRRRRLHAGGRGQDRALHAARLRQAAHLHGQDPPQPEPQPGLKGVPKGFRFPVRDIKASVGAGFLYPALRGHADHAGPADPAGLLRRRPGSQDGQGRGPVLSP